MSGGKFGNNKFDVNPEFSKSDQERIVMCSHDGCKTKIKRNEVVNFGGQTLCKPCFDDFNDWHYKEYGFLYT